MINNKKYVDDVGIKTFADKVKEKNTKQDESIDSLKHRSSQMEQSIKDITVSGGASVASAVSYNDEETQLDALNVQSAIEKLDKKVERNLLSIEFDDESGNLYAILGIDTTIKSAFTDEEGNVIIEQEII